MRRLLVTVISALIVTGLLAGESGRATAADDDRLIIAGDQSESRVLIMDPAVTDWNDPSAIEWEWEPTAERGFSAAEIAAFGRVTDFELRNTSDGPRMAVTASYGLAALISYPEGERIWAQILPTSANLHGVEILPDGNVAISSTNTSNGWVRLYAASQGSHVSTYAQHSLNAQSHGVVWDPVTERLWVVGKEGSGAADPRIITALAVTGTPAQPRLTEDRTKWRELPDIGSHDITADPSDPNTLLIALDATAWEFDKTAAASAAFTQITPADGGLSKLKAISRQPSGQTVITRPDHYETPNGPCALVNYWCTDTVRFFGPDTTRTMTGAQFYRARVLSPDYSAIGDTVHGSASDRLRANGGTWSAPVMFEPGPEVGAIASTSTPDGSLHVFTLADGGGGIWHRVRSAAGVWSSAAQIDANPAVTAVSATSLPDGAVHVQTVVPGNGVWNRVRSTSGTWTSAARIDANGAVTAVSASSRGSIVHVQTLVPGAGVWDRTRSAGGTWSSASKIVDGCEGSGPNDPCVTDISSAVLADGTMHVQTLVPGRGVYDMTRSSSGGWSAPALIDANGGITRISAAALSNGELHVQTVVPGFGVWDRTRSGAGSWSSASKVSGGDAIFEVYGAGVAANLHLGVAEYVH